jgi:hypothetical protein
MSVNTGEQVKIERLRLAFPKVLMIPGMETRGGYLHVGIYGMRGEDIACYLGDNGEEGWLMAAGHNLPADDLLPLVDPVFPGTWAILLAELAKLVGVVKRGDPAPTGYAWARTRFASPNAPTPIPDGYHWYLTAAGSPNGRAWWPVDPRVDDIEDPATALVEAFILAREGRKG